MIGRTDWRALFRARAHLFFAFHVRATMDVAVRRLVYIAHGLVDGNGNREGEGHHSEGNGDTEETHAGSILVGEVVEGWVAHSNRD